MSDLFWVVLLFAVQVYVSVQGLVGKGRVITIPMVMFILNRLNRKNERKNVVTMKDVHRTLAVLQTFFSSPVKFRFWQLAVLFIVAVPIDTTVINYYPGLFYFSLLALYLDDWLTGDDRWKRRWQSLKNKLKWKVFVPSPVRSPS